MDVPAVTVIRAGERFVTSAPGLESRHSFSFGEHYDPANVGYGPLLASNHELVRSGSGFDDHPHSDTEIITWVLSGSLVHRDSYGNSGVTYPGLAARMSAGSGIVHSERNDAYRLDPARPAEPVEFVQMWVRPDQCGTPPTYQQREVDRADRTSGWVPVASGADRYAAVSLGSAGSTLWVSVVDPGVTRTLPAAVLGHLYLARGEVEVEGVGRLRAGDATRLRGDTARTVTGVAPAELLLWSMDG